MDTAQTERNPNTHTAHKRQVFLQITLPTLIGLLVLIALVVLVIYAGASGNDQVRRWADISLMWVLLPAIAFALLLLLLLIGLTFGLTSLLHVLPIYTYRLQMMIHKIQDAIKTGADKVVAPILKLGSLQAGARRLLRRR